MNTYNFISQTPYIGCVETLGYPSDDVAQSYMKHIIQRIALMLPRRGWHIGTLKEFYPRQTSLLGLNVHNGVEICIRLRVPGNKFFFMPFHEVVCTVLHELAHCQENKHNMPFWNLYYELLRECEALEVKMLVQGEALYPEHIVSSAEELITKCVGNRLQKGVKRGSEKGKTTSTQDSKTSRNFTALFDSLSNTQTRCGFAYRLGGAKLPAGDKPSADFLATIMENRLRRHDTRLTTSENATRKFDMESVPKASPMNIYTRCSSQCKLCGSWSQDNREYEACARDAVISIEEDDNPPSSYGQEAHILKHRRLEQSENNIGYATEGIHDNVVGLRASCPITVD